MSDEQTGARGAAEVARSYFEALGRRDPEAAAAHFADDGIDDVVPIGVLRGPAEVRAFFEDTFRAFPDFEFRVERVVVEGDVASVEWRASGTHSGGTFQGIEPTGKRVEIRGCDVAEVRDGKIVRNTGYYDAAEVARALGMLPARDSGAEKALLAAFNGLGKLRARLGR
ncbi:MAG: ester cyclase [Thermoleophilaceae bacterium]|nr:ester cyclase [Thermoleophilaceae bacterium]